MCYKLLFFILATYSLTNLIESAEPNYPGQYKFFAAIYDGTDFYEGALINNYYVLSSAYNLKPNISNSNYKIYFGLNDYPISDPNVRSVNATVIKHPDYNSTISLTNNNIALFKLEEPVLYDESIHSINLPTTEYIGESEPVTMVCRNGSTINGPDLLAFNLASIDNYECSYSNLTLSTNDTNSNVLCLKTYSNYYPPRRYDPCPAITYTTGRPTIVGFLVYIEEATYPALVIRVSEYIDWILSNMELRFM